ncbi:MAG: hypothetical protein H0X31_00240 [Nostocaceae cyanobacterium]|nr:hypothetical protein [Nostocaceae cyanobacterium]
MPNQRNPNRPRVQFVCSQRLADLLQEWADSENRSRSNLIETLLEKVIDDWIKEKEIIATKTDKSL